MQRKSSFPLLIFTFFDNKKVSEKTGETHKRFCLYIIKPDISKDTHK